MMRTPLLEHHFWSLVVFVLAVMAAVQFTAALGESQTWDEAVHLSAGYSYLKTADFSLNAEHPPLGKLLAALPLLFLNPEIRVDRPGWQHRDKWEFGREFLYQNRVPADVLLMLGRSPTMVVSILLGLAIALWTAAHFGRPAALLALLLFAFDPTVLAHGRYVTNDLLVTLSMFLACIAWGRFLREPARPRLLLAGFVLGLALLSKFSAVLLVPIFVALYLVRWWQERAPAAPPGHPLNRFSMRHLISSLGLAGAIAFLTLYAGYGFETRTLLSQPQLADKYAGSLEGLKGRAGVGQFADASTGPGRLAFWVASNVPVPVRSYFTGLYWVTRESTIGRPTFLLGQLHPSGVWYYFPTTFLLKTPLATLAFLLLAGILAARRLVAHRFASLGTWFRGLDFHWLILAIPPAIFVATAVTNRLNLGLRHLLPAYPFLFIFAAAVVAGPSSPRSEGWLRTLRVALSAVLVVESISIYPHHLAFFNVAVGGPGAGAQYLSLVDLDWGQDLKHLKSFVDSRKLSPLCLAYAGTAEPDYYSIAHQYLPLTGEDDKIRQLDCVAAISVGNLNARGRHYLWLQKYQPIAKIGYSIYIYDLRKRSGEALPAQPSPGASRSGNASGPLR
jgi:hypothetical protein